MQNKTKTIVLVLSAALLFALSTACTGWGCSNPDRNAEGEAQAADTNAADATDEVTSYLGADAGMPF